MTGIEIVNAVNAVCSMADDFKVVTIRVGGAQTKIKMDEFVKLAKGDRLFDRERSLFILDHGTSCFIAGFSSVESISLS